MNKVWLYTQILSWETGKTFSQVVNRFIQYISDIILWRLAIPLRKGSRLYFGISHLGNHAYFITEYPHLDFPCVDAADDYFPREFLQTQECREQ